MTAQIVIDAFQMGILRYGWTAGLLNRGVQCCCSEFRLIFTNSGNAIVHSMSRRGNCWDNVRNSLCLLTCSS